jgi:tRNA dimethylallyltransferase
MLRRVDATSAVRVQPRDLKRVVRALEVFFLTGTTMTDHFAATVSPLAGYQTVAVALSPPMALIAERVARRVDAQFEQGLMDEIRALIARGVPETARPFGGLVYRQALEHLHGARNEADTRELITRENRHYARRQLIWFRKEPNLVWIPVSGESPVAFAAVDALLT